VLRRGNEPPISLFLEKEKWAVHGPKRNRLTARIFPFGKIWPKYESVPNRPVRKPPGLIRLRCALVLVRTLAPHVDALGADFDGGSGRAVLLFPLPLCWQMNPVGADAHIGPSVVLPTSAPLSSDLRPKSRPSGGWPPKGGLRAALPTSALFINGGHSKCGVLAPWDAPCRNAPLKPPFLKEVAPPEAVTEDFTLQGGSPCGKTLGKQADVGIGPYGVSRCAGRFRICSRSA